MAPLFAHNAHIKIIGFSHTVFHPSCMFELIMVFANVTA